MTFVAPAPEAVVAWLAAGTRSYGFFLTAPIIARQVPNRVRLAFAMLLAFVVAPVIAGDAAVPPSFPGLAAVATGELCLGLTMGWMAALAFSAIHVGGTVMGFQIGTGVSALFDPQLGTRTSEIARLATTLVGMAVVVAGGHHLLVRGLLDSFAAVPIGGPWLEPDLALVASRLFSGVLVAGCVMALPVVGTTMISSLAIALACKATPQLNIYFAVGLLVNLVLGLLAVAAVLQHPVGGIDELLASMLRALSIPLR